MRRVCICVKKRYSFKKVKLHLRRYIIRARVRGVLGSCGSYVNSVNTILGEVRTDTAATIFLEGQQQQMR